MKQRGIALLAGLVFLAALSLLGLAAASGAIMQDHLAENFMQRGEALRSADRADAFARQWLLSRPDFERERGCNSDCLLPPAVLPDEVLPSQAEFESEAWWSGNALPAGVHPETGEILDNESQATPPRWLITEMHYQATGDAPGDGSAEAVGYYRILSRGVSRPGNSVVVTESIVARPWHSEAEPPPFPATYGAEVGYCNQFHGRYACDRKSWRQRR